MTTVMMAIVLMVMMAIITMVADMRMTMIAGGASGFSDDDGTAVWGSFCVRFSNHDAGPTHFSPLSGAKFTSDIKPTILVIGRPEVGTEKA